MKTTPVPFHTLLSLGLVCSSLRARALSLGLSIFVNDCLRDSELKSTAKELAVMHRAAAPGEIITPHGCNAPAAIGIATAL